MRQLVGGAHKKEMTLKSGVKLNPTGRKPKKVNDGLLVDV